MRKEIEISMRKDSGLCKNCKKKTVIPDEYYLVCEACGHVQSVDNLVIYYDGTIVRVGDDFTRKENETDDAQEQHTINETIHENVSGVEESEGSELYDTDDQNVSQGEESDGEIVSGASDDESVTSDDLRSREQSLISIVTEADAWSSYSTGKGRDHKRVKLANPGKDCQKSVPEGGEALTLMKEKLQCLCKVVKEVLGAKVEDVIVSDNRFLASNSCLLRDSGIGGMTMENNPEHRIIEDLRKRSDADKNDFQVRNVVLALFNYADMCRRIRLSHEQYLDESLNLEPTQPASYSLV